MAALARCVSRNIIRPSSATRCVTRPRIELTPWELQFIHVGYFQEGMLFRNDPRQTPSIDRLQSSLSRTLDFFYPLAGRLAATKHEDCRTSFSIDCNYSGAEFVHATADAISVSDVINPVRVPNSIIRSFFDTMTGVQSIAGLSRPLLHVQVTELKDGAYIGFSFNHAAMDGTSFWHLVHSWSEIYKGAETISKIPCFERSFTKDSSGKPIRVDLEGETDTSLRTPPLVEERVFHFRADSLKRLKWKANSELVTLGPEVSSNQALIAHLWRSVIRNSPSLDSDENVRCMMPICRRSRAEPPLSDYYFGSPLCSGLMTSKARDVLDAGLGNVSRNLNKMIASHKKMGSVEKQRLADHPFIFTHEKVVSIYTIMFMGSPRFDAYGVDLGWGAPIALRSGPSNKFSGLIELFPGKEKGSVDVQVCMSPDVLVGMETDEDFMEFVV